MKRLTACLVVGALVLTGIFILNRPPVADSPPVVAAKTSPAAIGAPVVPPNISAPVASVAKISADAEKPFTAFENFQRGRTISRTVR